MLKLVEHKIVLGFEWLKMSEAIVLFLIRLHDVSRNKFIFTTASKTSVSPPTRTCTIVVKTLKAIHNRLSFPGSIRASRWSENRTGDSGNRNNESRAPSIIFQTMCEIVTFWNNSAVVTDTSTWKKFAGSLNVRASSVSIFCWNPQQNAHWLPASFYVACCTDLDLRDLNQILTILAVTWTCGI
jgi:hypothetical protein